LSYNVLGTAVARQARDDAAMGVRHRAAQRKSTIAGAVYAAAVVLAFRYPALALLLDLFVAIIYFIPGTWTAPRSRDGIREEFTV
jgi:hypothetical protein